MIENSWSVVAAVTAATAACKTSGFWLRGRALPLPITRVLPVLAPALLAAMVINASFSGIDAPVLDARIGGLFVATLALLLRLPLLAVMALAAGSTALLRAFF
ncbi:AzlD domain-containing protein [Permianibacter sp. IMCC34836]|uniref:AzlD domain-containing protein n=1 Tax=Permianibacter fluminis TaxID=2738515 RepID=UPI001556B730|nr:AzlD domain-containing protein [Permianibacter fluminis]NQD38108.1 AzlD domain-containing protein [Permianibacter fluminis]